MSESAALSRASGVSDLVLEGTGDFEGDLVAGRPPSTPKFREGVETFEIGTGGDDRAVGLAFLLPPSIPILLVVL